MTAGQASLMMTVKKVEQGKYQGEIYGFLS
jgi:hypothetical protein